MQIRPDQLPQHLDARLQPVYTIPGDEPLLAQEACDAIRNAARAAGYTERKVFTVGQHFDWSGLLGAAQALSLFADRQLIEIRIPPASRARTAARRCNGTARRCRTMC